jgi:RNA polymerase sigma-70 factor (ECF subfamily)
MSAVDALQADPAQHLSRLLVQVAGGDREAFEQVYRLASGRLYAICLRLLHDRGEAEDVLQEVFAAVWNKAGRFDPAKAGAMTWLSMVTRNRAIDRLRAAPPRTEGSTLEAIDEAVDEAPQPPAAAQNADDRERIARCLELLDARRRQLIRAAFFDGASYEELARRIGSPLGSVKSWIRRGLSQLRVCLEQ